MCRSQTTLSSLSGTCPILGSVDNSRGPEATGDGAQRVLVVDDEDLVATALLLRGLL
jgi:hypothetical protein